jgi:hypothetical protein
LGLAGIPVAGRWDGSGRGGCGRRVAAIGSLQARGARRHRGGRPAGPGQRGMAGDDDAVV